MERLIEHAAADRYEGFVEKAPAGRTARTHIGLIRLGNDTGATRMHIKLHDEQCRGLVNEITGYLLARHAGIAVPTRAAIVQIKGAALASAWPRHKHPEAVAWATQTMHGRSPHYIYTGVGLHSMISDLIGWTRLPDTLAFDEWTANADRNAGNLIRTGAKAYCLIDHDHLITGVRWLADLLDPSANYANCLARMLWQEYDQAPLPAKNAMYHAAERFAQAWQNARPELHYWWEFLLDDDDFQQLDSFLTRRAHACTDLIKQRFPLAA